MSFQPVSCSPVRAVSSLHCTLFAVNGTRIVAIFQNSLELHRTAMCLFFSFVKLFEQKRQHCQISLSCLADQEYRYFHFELTVLWRSGIKFKLPIVYIFVQWHTLVSNFELLIFCSYLLIHNTFTCFYL